MHLPLSFVFFCVYFWLCQPIVLIFETDIKISYVYITFRCDKNECTAIATKYLAANYMYWFNWEKHKG